MPVNNNFELKLLLNPGFATENEDFIQEFNTNFAKKVTQNKIKYKSYQALQTMPIVWFYFDSESQRKDFVDKVRNWKEIY